MKIVSITSIILMLFGNCFAGQYDTAHSTAGITGPHFPRHFKRVVRKDGKPDRTDIKPVTPATGIMSGFVMIYGYAIKPPYKVQVENGKTSINGVPVGPGTTEKDIISARAGDLVEEANKIFCERGRNGNYSAAASEIATLFEKSTNTVVSAKWHKGEPPPKGILLVHWKGNVKEPGVRFGVAMCGKRPDALSSKGLKLMSQNKRRHDSEFYSKSLQKSLEEGKLLFFGYDSNSVSLPADTKAKIDEAMKDESLERKDLMEKLKNLGFNHHGALEVVRNYTPE